jgi:hypothetical protein
MRKAGICAALAATISVSGCATGYGDMGLTGGVTAKAESDGTWLILAAGNGYTTVEAISDFTFLKAAEVTKAQGAVCFEIVGQYAAMEDESMSSQYGTMNFKKPDGRLRIRILKNTTICDDKTNADALIARLGPKVKDPKAYPKRSW